VTTSARVRGAAARRRAAVPLGVALTLGAMLAAPAGAGAQDAQGDPVVGGGSFADAPLIESGSYRDTILPGERLFYGVRLEPGQQLRVAAQLDVEPGSIDTDTAAGFSVGLQTPLREVITETDSGGSTVGSADERIEVTFPAALAGSGARDRSGAYFGPGVWYLSLYLSSLEREPARVEFPVEFELEVVGDPQPDASPEPTPAKPEATPRPEGDDGGGTSAAAVAGIGMAGLLIGLIGGGLAARRS
jgi:Ca-activated chloride channel homolog